jgi:hypothetical protein
MEEEIDDFDKTLVWMTEEENLRSVRKEGFPSFYLIIAALFIFVVCFFILYFSNRRKKIGALDMMKDPDNVFEEFTDDDGQNDQNGDNEDDVPLIDLSNEDEKPLTEEPILTDNIVEPKAQEV